MEPIDWKRKLSSRKFWAAICNFVTDLVIAFGVAEEVAVKIASLIMAGATVIAYIIAEGLVDAKNKEPEYVYVEDEEVETEDTEDTDAG